MGQITKSQAIVIPRLEDPASASAEERDEHLMLLEAARHELDIEFIQTLAAADAARDHRLMSYPSTVAYLKDRLRMAAHRANYYLKIAQAALRHPATLAAWRHRQISTDEAGCYSERRPPIPTDKRDGGGDCELPALAGDTLINVHIDLDALEHRLGGLHETRAELSSATTPWAPRFVTARSPASSSGGDRKCLMWGEIPPWALAARKRTRGLVPSSILRIRLSFSSDAPRVWLMTTQSGKDTAPPLDSCRLL